MGLSPTVGTVDTGRAVTATGTVPGISPVLVKTVALLKVMASALPAQTDLQIDPHLPGTVSRVPVTSLSILGIIHLSRSSGRFR